MSIPLSLFFDPSGASSLDLPLLSGHGCFLRGTRQSGKTSFAFQAVVNTVLRGDRVMVLCQEHIMYSKLPQPFTALSALDASALRRIEFAYVESCADVMREFCAWNDASEAPSLVVVDDDSMTDAANVRVMAQMLSALENVFDWMQRCGKRFVYVFVSNNYPDHSQSGELPLCAFPFVSFFFSSTGNVVVHPTETDAVHIPAIRLGWNDGLELCL